MHLASWPPQCSECRKFMPHKRSKIVRKGNGPPNEGEDDYEIGMCKSCEERIQRELDYINSQAV